MKRIITWILALVCCLTLEFTFVACNGGEKAEEKNGDIFYMTYNGTKIALDAKAAGVLSALGEANSVKELGDCGGLGAQVKYTYNDIELYTLKSDDSETVDHISFTSDLVSTSKNISLGDSKDKVIEAYGEPTKQSDSEIRYTEGDLTLKFKLDGGNVSAIDYMRVTQ